MPKIGAQLTKLSEAIMMLDRLNEINDVKIHSVFSEEFKTFGRVIEDTDFSSLCEYMKANTNIPEKNNI